MNTRTITLKKATKATIKKVLTLLLMLISISLKANPVDMRTARKVAEKFINTNTKVPVRCANDLQLVTTYNISRGDTAFYIFNTPNGFVIVAANDCATPILGYSNEGQFDLNNIPIQLQDYLQNFVEQIQYGIDNHFEADKKTAQEWESVKTTGRLTCNRSNKTVEPLLTTEWGQGCGYNAMCPVDENGVSCGHAVTGCVATAMAQIMRYWSYPENGIGTHSYIPESHPEYGNQSVDFGATTYQWSDMPNTLNNSNSETIATLIYHCGVSVDMDYGPNASEAWSVSVGGALTNYFRYSNEMSYEGQSSYTDASWKAKLKDCIDLGRPVYYSGSTGSAAHAFVCDGYDMNDMFHINWGWSGSSNGYFAIGALNVSGGLSYYEFNTGNSALFNIHPQDETTNYVINVSSNNAEGGIVMGEGVFAHGSLVTLTATANSGYSFCYWEENGGVASTNPNYSFVANFNRNLVAVFARPFTITVSASEGGVAYGGGSYFYGQTCTVTATPDEGYYFANWIKNGIVVSTNANYTFTVTEESLLTAHFIISLQGNITFADANVKAICVNNWDNNGDGELSYNEATAVTDLSNYFRNTTITSFDELQYFNGLSSIGEEAFYYCRNLSSITFPTSVTSIGKKAFQYSSLTGGLTIPNSVTTINDGAFSDCISLTSLIIGNSVITIGDGAFFSCQNLTSLIIGNSVTSIGNWAFGNCYRLMGELTLPNSLTSIGDHAFEYCWEITSLTIPYSLTTIGWNAFYSCNGLTSILIQARIPPAIYSSTFYDCPKSIPVYVPFGSIEAYQSATYWDEFTNYQKMACMTIPAYSQTSSNWHFIASPLVENSSPTLIDSMITETEYDLYQFNLTGENGEWENYKVDSFSIVNGQGYLYANSGEVNIIFKGEFNEDETKEISLDYDVNAPSKGWNLVGNPFPCTAYINREYYVMNEAGTAINPVAVSASTPIPPCTGVFVKAETEGETVVFSRASGAQK